MRRYAAKIASNGYLNEGLVLAVYHCTVAFFKTSRGRFHMFTWKTASVFLCVPVVVIFPEEK